MMTKKVLIVCRYFPPYFESFGGVARALKLAEFLSDSGYKVWVLSSKGSTPIDYFGYDETLRKFECIYIFDKARDVALGSIAIKRGDAGTGGGTSLGKLGDCLKRGARRLAREFLVPDSGIIVAGRFVKEAERLIRENGIENVIVSSPPHSMQIVGLKLKRLFGDKINWIGDYRDSWNSTPLFAKKLFPFNLISESYERSAFGMMDKFTYISAPIYDKAKSRYRSLERVESRLIMNGYDEAASGEASIRQKNSLGRDLLDIGYFGDTKWKEKGGFRDPSPLFDALKGLFLRFPKLKDRVKLHFFGNHSIPVEVAKDFAGILEVNGYLPHRDAIAKMTQMDYLMILHSKVEGSDEVVTGKFFEYLSVKRPMLVIGPRQMEAYRLVEKMKIGVAMDITDSADMQAKLHGMIAGRIGTGDYYKDLDITGYSRRRQYSGFLEILR